MFGEVIKDRFKPKSSSEIARERAYHLYQKLGEVSDKTNFFVVALQSYADTVSNRPPIDVRPQLANNIEEVDAEEMNFIVARVDLEGATYKLFKAIAQLQNALERVYPQLEIHDSELVKSIIEYSTSEERFYEVLPPRAIERDDSEVLQQLVNSAKKNERLIKGATDDMRAFLRKEFSFKESF